MQIRRPPHLNPDVQPASVQIAYILSFYSADVERITLKRETLVRWLIAAEAYERLVAEYEAYTRLLRTALEAAAECTLMSPPRVDGWREMAAKERADYWLGTVNEE